MKLVLTEMVEKYLNDLQVKERVQVLKKINLAFLLKGRVDGDFINHLEDKVDYIRRPGGHRLFFIIKDDMILFFAYHKKSQKLPEKIKEKVLKLSKNFI